MTGLSSLFFFLLVFLFPLFLSFFFFVFVCCLAISYESKISIHLFENLNEVSAECKNMHICDAEWDLVIPN